MLAATCTKSGAGARGKSCRGPCSAVPHSPGTDPLHLALQRMLEQNPAAWHQAQALLALLELLCSLSLLAVPSSLPPVWRHLILAGSRRVVLARWCSSCVRVPAASAGSRGRAVASGEVTLRCATKEAVSSKLRGLWHRHSPLLWFLAVNEGEREALSLSPTCAWSVLLGLEQAVLQEAAARCCPTPCSQHASELRSAQVEA